MGTKKLVPDGVNVIVSDGPGTKRSLTIHDASMKHCGDVSAKTNKDKSTAPLHVGILNEIVKPVTSDAFRSIAGMVFAVEREEVVIYVEVKDPEAPVHFYINNKKLDESDFRFEHTSAGGKHEFKIKKCELADAGILEARSPSNKGDGVLVTSTDLDVMMGERRPEVGKVGTNGRVEATAGKHCSFDVPFNVQGKKQSELNVKILNNEGKELKDGQDIHITMHDGKVSVEVINPKRGKSGNYKVTTSSILLYRSLESEASQ